MIKYRLEITKNDSIRYISHLDFASLMQRAICRAKLPASYSEGFNPHMKISFASALSVGVTSEAEYMDLELKKDICQPELFDKLSRVLPAGVKLLKAKQIDMKAKALMSIVDEGSYSISLPITKEVGDIDTAINRLNSAKEIIIVRETPKKRKEIEIKQYLPKPIKFEVQDDNLNIYMNIKITSTGTTKANEVLTVLKEQFNLQIPVEEALICRTGLYHEGKNLIDLD